jgi:hypothetical protein
MFNTGFYPQINLRDFLLNTAYEYINHQNFSICEISGSHGSEYDGPWNFCHYLRDYTVQHPENGRIPSPFWFVH